jgi:hypothetical protein
MTTTGTASRSQSISGQRKVTPAPDAAAASRPRRVGFDASQVGEAQDGVSEIVVGGQFQRVDACLPERGADVRLAALGDRGKALPEPAVMGIDQDLVARLRVLHHHHAEIGKLHFQAVVEAHGDDLMAPRELRQRLLPSGQADEVRYHEYQRPPRHHLVRAAQQLLQVGRRRAGEPGPRKHPMHDVEHMPPSRARRYHRVHAVAVEQRTDAIAVTAESAGEHRDQLRGDGAFPDLLRAEIDRGTQVKQEPGGELTLLVVNPDVRRLQARGDVPVDVTHVIVELVFAQIGQVDPEAAKQGPVVAVEQSVEAAQHRPFEAAEDRLRRLRPL